MNKNYDIIILGQSRWDNPYSSSSLCIAKEFSKNNRVFYIDHPFSIKDFISQYKNGTTIKSRLLPLLLGRKSSHKVPNLPDNFTVIIPKLTLPINWLSDGFFYSFFSKINDKIVLSALKKAIKKYNIKEYIFINSFDPYYFRSFPKAIAPKIKIYQTVDDISQEAYIARHGVRLEKEAIANADITLATSKELTRIMSNYTNRVYCLPNAADFSLFQKAINENLDTPKELIGITQKVICYTGVIGNRINFELLKKIALYHADKLLLMVGPQDLDSYKSTDFDKLPNIVFTGPKKISELPAYLQHSHCAIIPFVCSVQTKSIYPLKINEYLTAGKPVVATAFSEDIIDFAHVAYIAKTEQEFVNMINVAINEDNYEGREKRIKEAESNTWEARVQQFWKIVEKETAKLI
jgi:teichuronic acid biosynthesis glycosyltransferase TuaH